MRYHDVRLGMRIRVTSWNNREGMVVKSRNKWNVFKSDGKGGLAKDKNGHLITAGYKHMVAVYWTDGQASSKFEVDYFDHTEIEPIPGELERLLKPDRLGVNVKGPGR